MRRVLCLGALIAVVHAAPAVGAPPPNDIPAGAGVFASYAAPNGVPTQQEATAELVEAGPDVGIPRCLGPASFERTVWYRVPESSAARKVSVEAVGATTNPVDLAAFVQPPVSPYAPPGRQATQNTGEPNVCDGEGAGAGGDAPDRVSAVSMLVPAGHPVLIQAGRHGTRGTPTTERALLTLEATDVVLAPAPRGDRPGTATPRLREGTNSVDLAGATITADDPAQAPCSSLGTVWRQLIPGSSGLRVISVSGLAATTVTAFAGRRPKGDNALDCVIRSSAGKLDMVVPVKRNRPVWVRVGTDGISGDEAASIHVRDGALATIVDGGSGGTDPTPGGPGGGFPAACDKADVEDARVSGRSLTGRAGAYNRFTRIPLRVRTTAPVCDATLRLYGPGGSVFALGRTIALRKGRNRVELPRLRTFIPGRYRLEVTGLTRLGDRAKATTSLTGRLTKK